MISVPAQWCALVPELSCSDIEASRHFYCTLIGADVAFEREGFVYLTLGAAQWMLEQLPATWLTGPLEKPFGRGINFQIEVPNVEAIRNAISKAGWPLFQDIGESWYRAGNTEHGQKEMLVMDPDGYLLRFVTIIGERALTGVTS